MTIGKIADFIRSFDAFRKKENVSNYDIGGGISDRELLEMMEIAKSLHVEGKSWIQAKHASLL